MSPHDLKLDVDDMDVDSEGVVDFGWPIARHETIAVRDRTLEGLIAMTRDTSLTAPDPNRELLSILYQMFLAEAVELFQAHALARRTHEAGTRPSTKRQRVLGALLRGESPPQAPFVKLLANGPPSKPGATWAMKRRIGRVRKNLRLNGFSGDLFTHFDPQREVLAVHSNLGLIESHARLESSFVRVIDPNETHPPMNFVADPGTVDAATVNGATAAVASGFEAGGERLPDEMHEYLGRWLSDSMQITSWRLAQLSEHKHFIPRRLWVGTSAGVWARILCRLTRREGGTTTGHDHGAGTAHLVDYMSGLAELDFCDEFIAFTPAAADSYATGFDPDRSTTGNIPKITSLPNRGSTGALPSAPSGTKHSRDSAIKTIMYTSSFYAGDRVTANVRIPDIVSLDWEARLFNHLGQWGFEVLHKPHPSSTALPRPGFVEQFGGRLVLQRLEAVFDQADAFMFSSSQSSTFPFLLASDKPGVFIDLGLRQWTPEAYDLLARRCAIVRGWFDEQNRIQIDWDEVRSAIEQARHLSDTTIVGHYWGTGSR